ncbi:hypothetical protein N0V90_007147 [Kalmusia sp. IMI 367209]|nr:hypothetical protein N0V90_007147 [Kalmusia sp. IMI 367209]
MEDLPHAPTKALLSTHETIESGLDTFDSDADFDLDFNTDSWNLYAYEQAGALEPKSQDINWPTSMSTITPTLTSMIEDELAMHIPTSPGTLEPLDPPAPGSFLAAVHPGASTNTLLDSFNVEDFVSLPKSDYDYGSSPPELSSSSLAHINKASTPIVESPYSVKPPHQKASLKSNPMLKSSIGTPKKGSAQEELAKQVKLRDAKQLLAEQAVERKRKREERALEGPPQRKRARKPKNSEEDHASSAKKQHGNIASPPSKFATAPHDGSDPLASPPLPLTSSRSALISKEPLALNDDALRLAVYFSNLVPSHGSSLPPDLPEQRNHRTTLQPDPVPTAEELKATEYIFSHIPYSTTLISLKTIKAVDTAWLNNITDTMWHTLSTLPEPINRFMQEYVQGGVSAWPYGKLRVLAHAGFLPVWWWLRERLVEVLRGREVRIDDEVMVGCWDSHREGWGGGRVF